MFNIGYKSVEEALQECEKHFDRELKLPAKLPPVEFTHHFGRFNDGRPNNEINAGFELAYRNEKQGINQFTINVRPVENQFNFAEKTPERIIETYKLKDGTKAHYFKMGEIPSRSFWINALVFEKEG